MNNSTLQKLFVPSLLATCIAANTAHAARSETQQAIVEGSTFATSTIVGTAVGGPVGFVIGAIGGAFLADQTKKANENEIALKVVEQERQILRESVEEQTLRIVSLEQSALDRMTFQILFATGKDTLSEDDMKRVQQLALFLEQHPNLIVHLDGHTDPRGTDEYNNVLSQERALAVKAALEDLGIDSTRIDSKGHGSSFSKASKGDVEAYAEDRRVDIHLEPADSASVAQN